MSKIGIKATGCRRWIRAVTATATAALCLTVTMMADVPARADGVLDDYPGAVVHNYSIPAIAPNAVAGGNILPDGWGNLGNPTKLWLDHDGYTKQVASVQNGSANWGTPVRSEVSSANAGQIWRFQLVGSLDVTTPGSLAWGNPAYNPTPRQRVPVYRIINYNNGSHTCLDALGGSGSTGTAVDSYGCDPNGPSQPNQLWIVGNSGVKHNEDIIDSGDFNVAQPAIFNQALQPTAAQSVIMNVASLIANGFDTGTAPVLSAGQNSDGYNAPLKLMAPTNRNVTARTTSWNITLAPPVGSPMTH